MENLLIHMATPGDSNGGKFSSYDIFLKVIKFSTKKRKFLPFLSPQNLKKVNSLATIDDNLVNRLKSIKIMLIY